MKIRGGGAEGPEYFEPENEYEADDLVGTIISDDATGIQCRACLCAVPVCLCLPRCCPACGGPGLLVNGEPACPSCDSWPASARWPLSGKDLLHVDRFLKTCGEHPVFGPEDEPTGPLPKNWKP